MTLPWFRDTEVRAFVASWYLPWLAGLNLAWESLQIPLYTIWTEASPGYIAFAILHCTLGDVLIAMASLALALIFAREGALSNWRWWRVGFLTLLFGLGYTIFSEWLNVTLFRWSYSQLMPTLNIAGFTLGMAPLLQWLILPPLALELARRTANSR